MYNLTFRFASLTTSKIRCAELNPPSPPLSKGGEFVGVALLSKVGNYFDHPTDKNLKKPSFEEKLGFKLVEGAAIRRSLRPGVRVLRR